MLRICRKGEVEGGQTLGAEEDLALRQAFGRFARPEARAAGAAVVRRYQHLGFGNWILCDCLGPGRRPPALVPVLESFIRRHTDPPWPLHAEGCDFHRDPSEQRVITRSYARPPAGPLRLLRRLPGDDAVYEPGAPAPRFYSQRREVLGTLLLRLVEKAGLNRVPADGNAPELGEQYRRLRAAAHTIEFDVDLPVSAYLCTYRPALPALFERIANAPPARFKRTRPHGIILAIVAGVGRRKILFRSGEALPVRGRISVFGEDEGNDPNPPAGRGAHPPYFAICLAGRPSADAPVTILRAHVQPCVSVRQLMLVDSNRERATLAELLSLQSWLRANKGIRLEIEKPHFDILEDDTTNPEPAPREPCIPDFIVRAEGEAARGATTVLIETMSFADEMYRARKMLVHDLMAKATGAPVVLHDFHCPVDSTQSARDRRFWLGVRWAITGPDHPGQSLEDRPPEKGAARSKSAISLPRPVE